MKHVLVFYSDNIVHYGNFCNKKYDDVLFRLEIELQQAIEDLRQEKRIRGMLASKPAGHSGIGTTLAGNPMAMAALRACLEHVMTPAAYTHMVAMAERLEDGLEQLFSAESDR